MASLRGSLVCNPYAYVGPDGAPLEVITETGRRQWFLRDDKARIVEGLWARARLFLRLLDDITLQQPSADSRQSPATLADDLQCLSKVIGAVTPAAAVGQERNALLCEAKPDLGLIEMRWMVARSDRDGAPTRR